MRGVGGSRAVAHAQDRKMVVAGRVGAGGILVFHGASWRGVIFVHSCVWMCGLSDERSLPGVCTVKRWLVLDL